MMGLFSEKPKYKSKSLKIIVNGKEKEMKLDLEKKTVWIDPDKLDFDGQILNYQKGYYLAQGQSEKYSAYAYFTDTMLICCKEMEDGIEYSDILEDGTLLFFTDAYDFYIIGSDGKQQSKCAIGFEIENREFVYPYYFAYGWSDEGYAALWVYNIETKKAWSKKVEPDVLCEDFTVDYRNDTFTIRISEQFVTFDSDGKKL